MVSRFPSLSLLSGILRLGPLVMLLAFLLGACAETQPETRIISEGTTGQAPLTVSFTSDSRGVDEYRWDFGDGTFTNTSTSFPVDHEYTKVGSYLVTLTVIREADPPKSTTATVTISVEPGPLESLVLDLDEVVLAPREEHVFLVSAFDQFDNPIPGLEPDYQVDDQAGWVGMAMGTLPPRPRRVPTPEP